MLFIFVIYCVLLVACLSCYTIFFYTAITQVYFDQSTKWLLAAYLSTIAVMATGVLWFALRSIGYEAPF
jgi:hypothetical protein